MQIPQKNSPKQLNLDKSTKKLGEVEAFYLLNHDTNNPSALGKATGLAANYLACDMLLPAGENYSVGRFYSDLTNETYSWNYNSNGINFISRINGSGDCEVVWDGGKECLPLSPNPKHSIEQFRAYMKVDKLCANRHGKALVWVDGTDTPIGMIDVEASIQTDSFRTPFFKRCEDTCAPLRMFVPEPLGCINGEFVPFSQEDIGKVSRIVDRGFKFRIRHVYYDLRASEYSDISSLYFLDAKGCFDNGEGYPRCIKFRIPAGNPLVDKIEFCFSEDGGVNWYTSDIIEKYKKYNSTQQYWYERDLSEDVSETYSELDCSFDYVFCNDKPRVPIDPLQMSREFNPMPRAAQCILSIKESIGFINYEKGNCPIDKIETDKFDININCDSSQVNCNSDFATVTVRAIIYNPVRVHFVGNGIPGYIYREHGTFGNNIDDPADPAWFGLGQTGFDQTFSGTTRNFIAYIEGTNYWGEMKQWKAAPNLTSVKEVGVLSGVDSTTRDGIENDIMGTGNFYYQEYKFTVRKGEKGFIRLASHHQTSGIGNNQNTSTHVIGMLGAGGLKTYSGVDDLGIDSKGRADNLKEMYFDTCNGDFDNYDAFIVNDLLSSTEGGYSGYITDLNNAPAEGVKVYGNGNWEATTDFNGFYCFNDIAASVSVDLYAEQSCPGSFSIIENFHSQAATKQMSVVDFKISKDTYKNDFFAKVNILVKDCDGNPVNGVRVAVLGSKYRSTDTTGVAHFKLRNYSGRNRSIIAVIMDKGNCFTVDCNGVCNPCMPFLPSTLMPSCFEHTPQLSFTIDTNVNTQSLSVGRRGLKMNGRYAFGFIVEGDEGRISAVNEIKYIDIPSRQDMGQSKFCSFTFDAGGIVLPSWVNRLKIVRSYNLNTYKIQWVVDKVDRTVNGKIKLSFQSLNDYNAQYNFKTNTAYGYLQGDRVEFISNGDGKVFDSATYGTLNYLVLSPFNDTSLSGVTNDTNFFNQLIIIDDGKLDGLKEGAVIEIQQPATTVTAVEYFEICASLEVKDGEVLIQSGSFYTFDTFLVSRQIGKFPTQLFESKTPSDFWGGINLDDTGKVHFVNKYENQRRHGRNITVNSPAQFNYFGYIEKTFNAKDQGDIIAASLKDDKVGLGISENDNFIFEVSDQFLRVGNDNIIHATTADAFISNPEAKLRGKYGCSYEDVGSVFFGDGFALYIDEQNDVLVIHDYRIAKPAGEVLSKEGFPESSCSSFFKRRVRRKAEINRSASDFLDYYRYSIGFNKHTGIAHLTTKSLRMPGVNNEKGAYLAENDTIMYSPESDSFSGFASFTGEGYSQLNLNNKTGCAFVMYQNGLPYIHPALADKWNEFCGIACDQVIGISLNKGEDKLKKAISIEIQSKQMFFVSKVTTDVDGFLSEIPPAKFKRSINKWNAQFLNNINSRGGLFNGDSTVGYNIQIVLVKDNSVNLQYGTIDNEKRTAYNEIDNILLKFIAVEQSGFDSNL